MRWSFRYGDKCIMGHGLSFRHFTAIPEMTLVFHSIYEVVVHGLEGAAVQSRRYNPGVSLSTPARAVSSNGDRPQPFSFLFHHSLMQVSIRIMRHFFEKSREIQRKTTSWALWHWKGCISLATFIALAATSHPHQPPSTTQRFIASVEHYSPFMALGKSETRRRRVK